MIPAPFEYERASSADEAISLLGQGGADAKLLAGGHSLLPLMKLRLARPSLLIDIGRLDDLAYVREDGEAIAIGALTRHCDVERAGLLERHCRIVSTVATTVGDPQVRHRGTIGGSLAHGDAASDLPAVLVALDAELTARGPQGERTIRAADFFAGFFETALADDELLTEIRVPRLDGYGVAYQKFRRRAHDWAIVGVAAMVRAEDGTIADARVGLTNMGPTPVRATAVEQALRGASRDGIGSASGSAAEGTDPPSDTNATAEFRQHLARVLTRRAVEEALAG